MWWLYLDESGDLGFDFVNKRPSEFFTICILATSHCDTNRRFRYAVKKTLKRKVNHGCVKHPANELHANRTSHGVKVYLREQLNDHMYGVYALTLNKRRVYQQLAANKARVYNYVARMVVDQVPFEKASGNVLLTADRCKGTRQRMEFNRYIEQQLQGRLDPATSLDIVHEESHKSAGLQVVDQFAWAIHRSYERKEDTDYALDKEKVLFNEQYL